MDGAVGATDSQEGAPSALGARYTPAAGHSVDAKCEDTGDRVELAVQVSRGAGAGAVRGLLVEYTAGGEDYELRIPITIRLCVEDATAEQAVPECA